MGECSVRLSQVEALGLRLALLCERALESATGIMTDRRSFFKFLGLATASLLLPTNVVSRVIAPAMVALPKEYFKPGQFSTGFMLSKEIMDDDLYMNNSYKPVWLI